MKRWPRWARLYYKHVGALRVIRLGPFVYKEAGALCKASLFGQTIYLSNWGNQ